MRLGAIALMGLGLTWSAAVKREHVGAAWEFDDDGVFGTVGVVVFGEFYAQASSLHPDHGIELGIEVRRAAEDLGRNLILLDGSAGMVERMLGEIAQEFAQLFGAMEGMAVHQLIDLS